MLYLTSIVKASLSLRHSGTYVSFFLLGLCARFDALLILTLATHCFSDAPEHVSSIVGNGV